MDDVSLSCFFLVDMLVAVCEARDLMKTSREGFAHRGGPIRWEGGGKDGREPVPGRSGEGRGGGGGGWGETSQSRQRHRVRILRACVTQSPGIVVASGNRVSSPPRIAPLRSRLFWCLAVCTPGCKCLGHRDAATRSWAVDGKGTRSLMLWVADGRCRERRVVFHAVIVHREGRSLDVEMCCLNCGERWRAEFDAFPGTVVSWCSQEKFGRI